VAKVPLFLGKAIIKIDPAEVESGGCIERWYPIYPATDPIFQSSKFLRSPSSPYLRLQNIPENIYENTENISGSRSSGNWRPLAISSPVPSRMSGTKKRDSSSRKPQVLVRINFSKLPGEKHVPERDRNKPIEEYYTLGKTLGLGGFSVVKQATDKITGREVAVKIININQKSKMKDDDEPEEDPGVMIQQEIEIMKMLKHPNIVEFYEFFQTTDQVFVVMELVTGGELLDIVSAKGSFAPSEAAEIIREVLLAVDYMHKNGIVHRDLKLENLLVDEKNKTVKITDFGLSKNYFAEVPSKCVGSILYIAPEVLLCDTYDNAVDVWSIGVMTYMLLSGSAPFDSLVDNEMEIFEKICKGDYSLDTPEWKDIGHEPKDFIRRALVLNPTKRATAACLLKHPWITSAEASKPQSNVDKISSPQYKKVALRLSQLNNRSKHSINGSAKTTKC